jgi:hypothetical protein
MFNVFSQRPKIISPFFNEYCLSFSKNYCKKLIERKNEERNNKFKLLLNKTIDTDITPNNPKDNIIPFVCFLSITSILIYFYNTKK